MLIGRAAKADAILRQYNAAIHDWFQMQEIQVLKPGKFKAKFKFLLEFR